MASLSWPWEPLEPKDSLSEGAQGNPRGRSGRPPEVGQGDSRIPLSELRPPAPNSPSESEYDAEEADNPTQRLYDEMNWSIEPHMEEWRPER